MDVDLEPEVHFSMDLSRILGSPVSIPVRDDSDLSDNEINSVINGLSPGNTRRQTSFGVNKFNAWLAKRPNISINFDSSTAEELNVVLRKFYLEVRTKKGAYVSPGTLNGIRAALHRHLTNPPLNRAINILHDTEFIPANKAFKASCQKYVKEGGAKPQHKAVISTADMGKMAEYLRDYKQNPLTLLEAMWFILALNFGRRGREGWRNMKQTTFATGRDDEGEYIYMRTTESTKNHQGGTRMAESDYNVVKVYSNGTDVNPLDVYKFYTNRLTEHESFFQKPKSRIIDGQWFDNAPIGVHTIENIMKKISGHANLDQIYTNHCVRATSITTMARANVAPQTIVSRTLHKNIGSLKPYLEGPSNEQQKECCVALSRQMTSTRTVIETEDISDDELVSAFNTTMESHYSARSSSDPAHVNTPAGFPTAMGPIVIQSGAVLNNCTFNFGPSKQ